VFSRQASPKDRENQIHARFNTQGLLLSELGAYLLAPDKAPAGTKRLSNLLRSQRWCPDIISHFLWRQAKARQQQLQSSGEQALVAWDASVLEKPESVAAEGLCPVRSQKAARLKRIKSGFYTPPPDRPSSCPACTGFAYF
jgi:hypothetical protein